MPQRPEPTAAPAARRHPRPSRLALRPSALALCLLPLLGALTVGCDDDGGAEATADGGGGAGGGDAGCGVAPFCGPLPAAPSAEFDDRDSLPMAAGGVWRYRLREENWQMPPPVTQGGETELRAGDDEFTFVRETRTVLEVPEDGTPEGPRVQVRQVLRETLRAVPANGQVGPKIEVLSLFLEERALDDGRLIRSVDRTWAPPYTLIEDTWRVGLIATGLSSQPQMTQVTRLGDGEPTEQRGVVDVSITTTDSAGVEPMEGRYREGIHRIEVIDDFSRSLSRTYWVEPGVGVVRWRFRETENLDHTLVETNLESAEAPAEE